MTELPRDSVAIIGMAIRFPGASSTSQFWQNLREGVESISHFPEEVVAAEGATVADGDTLVILESMKMEIPVLAEDSGTVTRLAVAEGDVVQEGDLIAVIE